MTKSRHQTVYFRPRNWERHQGYRKRGPAWIKNHTALLEDFDYGSLGLAERGFLHGLWLLYSRVDRPLPWDCSWIGRQLNATYQQASAILQTLKDNDFIVIEKKSVAVLSGERETEREREKESLTTFGAPPPNGGAPPCREIDPAKVCFQTGRDLLARYGINGKKAGALIGKWRKVRSDADLTAILLHAGSTERAEIIPFIEGALRRQVDRPRTFAEKEAAQTSSRLEKMLNGGYWNGDQPSETPGHSAQLHRLPRGTSRKSE